MPSTEYCKEKDHVTYGRAEMFRLYRRESQDPTPEEIEKRPSWSRQRRGKQKFAPMGWMCGDGHLTLDKPYRELLEEKTGPGLNKGRGYYG